MSLLEEMMQMIIPKKKTKDNKILTEQELLNVIDIKDKFLYTRDDYIFCYIKINPISLQLWSDNELNTNWRAYTSEFSSENEPFAIYSFCRPVEMSAIMTNYEKIFKETTDNLQKYIIQQTLSYLQEVSSAGEAIEKQTYIVLWQKMNDYAVNELSKRANDWVQRFLNCGSNAHILEEQEIIQLINAFTNPSTAFDEKYDEGYLNYNTPFINGKRMGEM